MKLYQKGSGSTADQFTYYDRLNLLLTQNVCNLYENLNVTNDPGLKYQKNPGIRLVLMSVKNTC